MRKKILIIIVLYKQNLYTSNAYLSLCSQLDNADLFVYDNSPCPLYYKELTKSGRYVVDPDNGGVSKAYNIGVEYAKNNNYKYVLLSDQDTFFDSKIIEEYLKSVSQYPNIKMFIPKIVIDDGNYLSPVRMWHFMSSLSKDSPNGIIDPRKYAIINSGILIDVNTYIDVGGYNELVNLDFSDFQFLHRFSCYYDKVYVVNSVCKQSFSNHDQNIKQKIERYKLFCKSIKNFETKKRGEKLWIYLIALKRSFSLSFQAHNLTSLKILFKELLS